MVFILSKLYCISDIHGSYEAFSRAINFLRNEKNVDFSIDKLVLLGDYVDRGPQSREVLEAIIDIQNEFGKEQIIALMGNHDEMFIEWLKDKHNYLFLLNGGDKTIQSFYPQKLFYDGNRSLVQPATFKDLTQSVIEYIYLEYGEILDWLFDLPLFYEEGNTLFVHAGFDEKDDWSHSDRSTLLWQYPAQHGATPCGKKVVAGHIMTRELHDSDGIFRSVDHIYIDGGAVLTGSVNILMVDTQEDKYFDAWTGKEII